MQKTVFQIAKMDCPSEEQMIRMKLAGIETIDAMDFDIANRKLTVYHRGDYTPIFQQLDALNFDTSLIDSAISEDDGIENRSNAQEQKLLWQVLGINFFFFILEVITGIVSQSMGLVADSLDMLADSIIYAMALFAVGKTLSFKKNIAKASGYFQMMLAIVGLLEVIRRSIGWTSAPDFQTMILISLLALIGNAICLYLLQKSKSQEAHMKASMIFTSNDVIVNIGVIVAGTMVFFTESKYPDLVIGLIVFILVGRGATQILQLSK